MKHHQTETRMEPAASYLRVSRYSESPLSSHPALTAYSDFSKELLSKGKDSLCTSRMSGRTGSEQGRRKYEYLPWQVTCKSRISFFTLIINHPRIKPSLFERPFVAVWSPSSASVQLDLSQRGGGSAASLRPRHLSATALEDASQAHRD